MLKYNSLEIYVLVCLISVILTCAVGALVIELRRKRFQKMLREVERNTYIADLERERNFYRTQYEVRDLLKEADETEAFNKLMREAGLDV